MTVGVFDSGVGGLTVVKSLLSARLFEHIIYFGDTARVPYGNKDKNTIIRYSLEALEFYKNFNIDLFIVACNTASAHAIPELRANAHCDVVGVIEPGVLALQNRLENKDSNVLVIGTNATVSSGRYAKLLEESGYKNIRQKATGLFVPIAEEGIFEGPVLQSVMEHYFGGMEHPDAVILGCTHFPLISEPISRYFGGIPLIHSGDAIVEHLQEHYQLKPKFEQTKINYFATENPEGLKSVAAKWLNS